MAYVVAEGTWVVTSTAADDVQTPEGIRFLAVLRDGARETRAWTDQLLFADGVDSTSQTELVVDMLTAVNA
jgi:hypothetical protein